MKKQGKIKSIPVINPVLGQKVLYKDKISFILGLNGGIFISSGEDGQDSLRVSLSDLKIPVVEYVSVGENGSNSKLRIPQHMPLKYSQWQSAIDHNEIDTEKIVNFVITSEWVHHPAIAKIIPTKQKLYTEKEMLEKCLSFGEHVQRELGFNFGLIAQLKIWNDAQNDK